MIIFVQFQKSSPCGEVILQSIITAKRCAENSWQAWNFSSTKTHVDKCF